MTIQIKRSIKPVKYNKAIDFLEHRVNKIIEKKGRELIWILEHKDTYTLKRIATAYYKYVHDDYDSINVSWLYIDYANRFLQEKAKQVIHCIIPDVYEFNTKIPNWSSIINFHRFHQYWEENPRTLCNHAGPEAHKKFAKHLAKLIA